MIKNVIFEKNRAELKIMPQTRFEAWDLFFCVPSYNWKMFSHKEPLILSLKNITRIEETRPGLASRFFENSSTREGEVRVNWLESRDFLDLAHGKIKVRPHTATGKEILSYLPVSCLLWYLIFIGLYLFVLESNGPTDFSKLYPYNILSAQHALFFLAILGGALYPALHYPIVRRWVRSEKLLSTLRAECISLILISTLLTLIAWDGSDTLQETFLALGHYLKAMFRLD